MRIDLYLVENGFAESRQKAQNMIKNGIVFADGKMVSKASFNVDLQKIVINGEVMPYVSRGGLKLEAALESFKIDVHGAVCADIGASTGGFTDCLIQNGASLVYAIDSGHDQLHPKLRDDKRIVSLEGLNAKDITIDVLENFQAVDIVVMDVSFISQIKIYSSVKSILSKDGYFITLIKPQFEAGREYIGKNGIVKDLKVHERIINTVVDSAFSYGWKCGGIIRSPICGGDGNVEYLAVFGEKIKSDFVDQKYISSIVGAKR